MASQGSAANPMDVDLPDANKPATDPNANKPATDPDANKPATDPDANKPATDPDANKPATDPPGKAGQLTPIQIKDIIYKIADYDGQGLPDVLPQGFALTIGEVKAILKDPANRQNDDTENNARLKREYKCDAALTQFSQYKSMGLKDEDLWKPGLGGDSTEWKGAASLNSEKDMLLQIADVEIEHASDIQDVIPPNFKLTPSEILNILDPRNWPDDEAKARQAYTKLKAAVENDIIELSQPLESSRDEDDRSLSEVGKNVLKQIFRCIAVVTDLTAMSEAIETNLPEGETITFSYLVKMADPTQWSDEEDKKIAKDAKIKINKLVSPGQRQSDFIYQHREKRDKPPTLREFHKKSHRGMTRPIKAIVSAIEVDGRDALENENAKAAAVAIQAENRKIKQYNDENSLPQDTGVVDYIKFSEMWLALVLAKKADEVETVLDIERSLKLFCNQNNLPKWYPHDDKPKPKQPRPMPSGFDNQTQYGSSVELWGSKAIAYVPSRNTEPWEYRPGYTPQGEKIEYRQRIGAGVHFVVHGPRGWRLTPSGSVGGKLARLSADVANVQWALSGQEASRYLCERLCQPDRTYKYDVWFVAIEQLDLERKIRVPNMIVGFISTINGDPDTEEKVAFPRTALDQFLGKDTAEALVSRHITPHRQLPLRQALAIGYQNAGASSANLRPLTQRGKATQESKLIEGLRNLCIESPQEFEKLTGSLGLVRADRRLEWKG